MRPKISIPNTAAGWRMLPQDWLYQVKLDDERAMLDPMGQLWTRFGKPFDSTKARKFEPAISVLSDSLRDLVLHSANWLDVALIGYRKTRAAFKVVLLDIPTLPHQYRDRVWSWDHLEVFGTGSSLACRLIDHEDPEFAAKAAANMGDQAEGIIGRNPRARYFQGESLDMLKLRFNP